jgi:hypothetical protein
MLRDKLDKLSASFESGAMPQIHVTIGQLAASKPAVAVEQPYETVSGD